MRERSAKSKFKSVFIPNGVPLFGVKKIGLSVQYCTPNARADSTSAALCALKPRLKSFGKSRKMGNKSLCAPFKCTPSKWAKRFSCICVFRKICAIFGRLRKLETLFCLQSFAKSNARGKISESRFSKLQESTRNIARFGLKAKRTCGKSRKYARVGLGVIR